MPDKLTIPERELMMQGHQACGGCGGALAMRIALKALGPRTIMVIPACCWAVIPGVLPYTCLSIPMLSSAFAATGATISGIAASLKEQGISDVTVVGWAGDGGTADIGIQALSGAVERGDDFIYFCYDNEAYMNTGIQRSGATPPGALTTTTPVKKVGEKKEMVEIMVAHRIPYAATANPAYPEDMVEKIVRAKSIHGPSYIHILAPCPTGWRYPSEKSVELARLAVASRIFPLYSVESGRYALQKRGMRKIPVKDYLSMQGRFRLDEEEIAEIQRRVDENWERLLAMEGQR
jgi:pyruvate/2-oxoacid:ferredoxin oxidoreductase beta subunit